MVVIKEVSKNVGCILRSDLLSVSLPHHDLHIHVGCVLLLPVICITSSVTLYRVIEVHTGNRNKSSQAKSTQEYIYI